MYLFLDCCNLKILLKKLQTKCSNGKKQIVQNKQQKLIFNFDKAFLGILSLNLKRVLVLPCNKTISLTKNEFQLQQFKINCYLKLYDI